MSEGMHFVIPWFEWPYIYDVRTKPRNVQVRRPLLTRPHMKVCVPAASVFFRKRSTTVLVLSETIDLFSRAFAAMLGAEALWQARVPWYRCSQNYIGRN